MNERVRAYLEAKAADMLGWLDRIIFTTQAPEEGPTAEPATEAPVES